MAVAAGALLVSMMPGAVAAGTPIGYMVILQCNDHTQVEAAVHWTWPPDGPPGTSPDYCGSGGRVTNGIRPIFAN
jgi:hypothetical protein